MLFFTALQSSNLTVATAEGGPANGPNSASVQKALFAFSRPKPISVDLGEKAQVFEKITSSLKEEFGLDKDQIVGLTGVNIEGTQLENFVNTPLPPLDITVEVIS